MIRYRPMRAAAAVCTMAGLLLGSLADAATSTLGKRATPTESVLWNFSPASGPDSPLGGAIAGPGGVLYGVTEYGGKYRSGTVFKLTPKGLGYSSTVIWNFGNQGDGKLPTSLVRDRDGAFLGTTFNGGTFNEGTVFRVSPSQSGYAEKILWSFGKKHDAAHPFGGLLVAAGGSLYGATEFGGAVDASRCAFRALHGCGAVYALTRSGQNYTERVLWSFGTGQDGWYSNATLIPDATGALYGTTELGGNNRWGVAFKLTPKGKRYTEQILWNFGAASDGAEPEGGLLAGADGALYGTTSQGGIPVGNVSPGTVFELTPSGSGYQERVLWNFNGQDGQEPWSSLIVDAAGNLYGTTLRGGVSSPSESQGQGTVFELTPSGGTYTERVLWMFQGSPTDGQFPAAGPLLALNGALYGVTSYGGNHDPGAGTAFKITP
jgi:uncharacterized repeat protein (TIGR03803 family)